MQGFWRNLLIFNDPFKLLKLSFVKLIPKKPEFWTCTECGFINDVTSDNVYESEEDYQQSMEIPRCPICGGMVQGDAPDLFCQTIYLSP